MSFALSIPIVYSDPTGHCNWGSPAQDSPEDTQGCIPPLPTPPDGGGGTTIDAAGDDVGPQGQGVTQPTSATADTGTGATGNVLALPAQSNTADLSKVEAPANVDGNASTINFPTAPVGSMGIFQSPYGFPSDPSVPPAPGFEWRGTGDPGTSRGNWYNAETNEWLHWDTTHHGVSHFDYSAPDGNEYWIWPDGSMTPKK